MAKPTLHYTEDPSYKTLKRISSIMDEAVRIPGTKLSFGLDPIIGIIPGVGDTLSIIISGISLYTVARNGIPARLIMAMTFNLIIDYLVGLIPGVGDFIDFFYKANRNNTQLLIKYYEKNPEAINNVQKSSTGLIIFASLMFLIILGVVGVCFYFIKLVIVQTFNLQ
ncbi:DUF4112 domain-containing protein [Flammeovirga kamogawensis]|uniref:DUF4112 domain-containing protein n=1 Tax=Flammeovirga kamogawensis TaxID=373891 RepID=A0ABX8GQT7_9BACT|nr:DUF4112 domain-containing protein [Flammeovirga kamogawensis]MBB6463225.1 hypothetical protein [Flammeovirga kamogawensis]QWG05925.1 DUF4112 domain-containing protein [Flammeovirga kamogawensis]TRX67750.1 DUF4112 domain-containing protein [Flammeovirga kamogawensis]